MTLPGPIQVAVQAVFDVLPLDDAMHLLVVTEGADDSLVALVERTNQEPPLAARPALQAGLWLYIDELDRSHAVSQGIPDATGSFWHGIMHRREGDFGNSHYWFNRVGHHPAMDAIDKYDAHAFIDEVAAQNSAALEHLIALQQAEWAALFDWCARR